VDNDRTSRLQALRFYECASAPVHHLMDKNRQIDGWWMDRWHLLPMCSILGIFSLRADLMGGGGWMDKKMKYLPFASGGKSRYAG